VNEQADADDDVDGDETDDDAPETIRSSRPALEHVLPFRAGYESEDRLAIQKALTRGSLAGVVSTSALELGLDIGDLDVVVLLNTPSSMKAFRQRIGRAGRRRPAVCILLDDRDQMRPLVDYVARPPEPSWLYLENRYIQYSNAMCAAAELQVRGTRSVRDVSYPGLPESFIRFVENELNPTEAVPPDLYGLKQKAQANPHYEFPIRSAAEPNFKVEDKFSRPLGTLSYAQVLREAYPGAIYYYMAQPHRVYAFDFKKAQIRVKRAKHFTTKPIAETMAFPDFKAGILAGWKSDEGFVCEAELQVSERVKGFTEQRGRTKTPYEYGPTSIYSQKPLTRFFQTTGVCWAFPRALNRTEPVAQHLLRAFSWACGIQERDLGYAFFKSNQGPFDAAPVQGTVIFDSVNGSLRLTERLAAQFQAVVQAAVDAEEDSAVLADLMTLRSLAGNLLSAVATSQPVPGAQQGEWVVLIARGQPAIYLNGLEGAIEVTVLGYRYTPLGIQYELKALTEPKFELHKEQHRHGVKTSVTKDGAVKWMVSAEHIQPVNGTTRFMRVNLMNGEELEGEPDVTA
jgi:DEAD/DEAH box helicase domain-containing protein